MDRAAGVAMAICFSVYVVVGLSGYIFAVLEVPGGVVPGDGLQMFPDDIDVIIARFCLNIVSEKCVSCIIYHERLHFATVFI